MLGNVSKKLRKTGTTTVGLVCKDGVVLAAERKVTMGYLVAGKKAEKILRVNDYIGMTIAGLVGDAQHLEKILRAELKLQELQEERRIPIKAAANLMATILYGRRYYPYYVQLIVGGFDTKPRLFSFDPSGSIQDEDEYFSSGSGSPMAFGLLEDQYKKGLSVEEGKKVAARAVRSAVQRDIASGGSGIVFVIIVKNGFKKLSVKEVEEALK